MIKFMNKVRRNEEGATAIEYGLIAALVALALIGALTAFGGSLQNVFTNASNTLAANGGASAAEEPAPEPAPGG